MHWIVEPHILTQEKPSGLKAKLTCGRNGYGLDGLWACPWSTHVPLHVIEVFIRLLSVPLSVPFLFDQDDELLDELDTVIVSAGKTVDQIKAMHALEKKKHADLCNKNRAISAHSVTELAKRDGLPVRVHHEAFQAGLDLPEQAAGMRMHDNAYECKRM